MIIFVLFWNDYKTIPMQSRIRIHTSDLWIRIMDPQKHVAPDLDSAPDPEH